LANEIGRAKRGKVWKHWLAAHSATRQAEVRAKDFFGGNLLRQSFLPARAFSFGFAEFRSAISRDFVQNEF